MDVPTDAVLLRIYLTEAVKWEHKPLYEVIVLQAREQGLAGATVLRGPMGFGRSARMHTAKILDLSINLPTVIEIVDRPEKINAFLPVIEPMLAGALVTLEEIKALRPGVASGEPEAK